MRADYSGAMLKPYLTNADRTVMRTTRTIKLIVALWIVFVPMFAWTLGNSAIASADTAPRMRTLLMIAADYWNVDRAISVNVVWDGSVCPADTAALTNFGCATIGSPFIYVRPDRWATATNVVRCALIVHEYGHAIIGLDHSIEPGSVMHEAFGTPRTCDRYAHPPRKGNPRA